MKRKNMVVIGMVVGCLMMVAGAAWAGIVMPGTANGTVKVGNLVLLLDANSWLGKMNWDAAVSRAKSLASGQCGLTDGSKAGQWRLPTRKELNGLVYNGVETQLNLGDFGYWSSDMGFNSKGIYDDSQAVLCYMHQYWSDRINWPKVNSGYVLPVRSGP